MDNKTTFDIFSIFTMLGGLAFFLYGMNVMSSSLEKLTGGKLESSLRKLTSSKFKSILLGMGITIAVQSSSAVTVMLVGLVNSGIMQLEQTVCVCFGADIGTTFTTWIMSLSGLKGDVFFIKMLKPESFSPILALIGIMMIMLSKRSKKHDIGSIMIGFAVIMFGMKAMSGAVAPLADSPNFQKTLVAFQNPLLGLLVGAAFTGIIQSSAASIGILQSFAITGAISYGVALPIIMGLNIGTCATALISSIGVKKNAKRVATVHIAIKIIGATVLLPIFIIVKNVFAKDYFTQTANSFDIALMHTIFNFAITFMLLPFSKQLVKLSRIIVKGNDEDEENEIFIDENLLNTPSVAIEACKQTAIDMAKLTEDTINDTLGLFKNGYDDKTVESIIHREQINDKYEDKLNGYLVRVTKSSITSNDSRKASKIMHVISNFERISDHAVNLTELLLKVKESSFDFSDEGKKEMKVLCEAIEQNIQNAFNAYINNDLVLAHKVEPLEEVVDNMVNELKDRHIRRLQNGKCSVEAGYIFQDILINFERISDHCSNIGGCIIEIDQKTNIHEYMNDVKENDEFNKEYKRMKQVYFEKLNA